MVAVVIHFRYNIRYGRIGAADSDVEEAASAADMHSRILTFPNGKNTCYIAGNVFPTARALVGYFEVTWHLTMKLFPAKITQGVILSNNGKLKQQRRRRLRKRRLKSEFAPLQTLSRLFQFVKCCQIFLEFNSKGLYQSSGKEKESCCLVFPSSTKREMRHFHVVVVQWRINLLLLCRSRCRRRRRCVVGKLERRKKRNRKARGAWWEGRRDPVRFLYIYIFLGFFIGIPSGASAKERGVVWFGSSVLGMSEGPYRHQHCLKFRLF